MAMSPTETTARGDLEKLDRAIENVEERFSATQRAGCRCARTTQGPATREGEAWARDDSGEVERIAEERIRVEATKASWNARLAGAERAVNEAKSARKGFIDISGDAVVLEHAEAAEQVAANLNGALPGDHRQPGARSRHDRALSGST
jgi:hypothetical protein